MKKYIETTKKKIVPILKQYDVSHAGIFGSYARGDHKKNSDIDIVVQFRGSKSLFDLARLEMKLEKILRRRIDLLTYNSLNYLIKERILKEEITIL